MSRYRWRFSYLVAALVVAAGFVTAAAATADPATPGDGGQPSSAGCANRVNNTEQKLLPCIRTDDLWRHMKALQAIADANPGPDGHPSRNSGEPGYKASAEYVANQMRAAGYDATLQTYHFFYFAYTAKPTFREISPTARDFALASDWNPGQSTGSTTAAVQPAHGIVIPPTPTPSSTSGCTAADFSGFVSGRVALIQRGGCSFGVKVLNAQAAGASGVVIFNEGNPGRTALVNGSLVDAAGNRIVPTIPVSFTAFDTGSGLLDQYNAAVAGGTALPVVNLAISAVVNPNAEDYNVIADSKGGDPNHVVVVDAHLDAIYGAGMLDNASGSVTVLDIAQMMRKVEPRNKLRFVWFGGEELGLLGSAYYVNNLSPTELGKIGYDLDADVTATPNYLVGVLDPAGVDLFSRTVSTTFPSQVYQPSTVARDQAIQYFDSIGKNHELFSPVGTDAFSFNMAGIPASGVLTGQDCCKNQQDVDLFGGSLGNFEGNVPSFDGGCVDNPFRWCDNLSNNDPAVLTFISRGFAKMVVDMAFDDTVLHSAGKPGPQRPMPARAPRGGPQE
ncbi:M28 family peptidase [Amycolatopsis benzoatilytica]|uniref:M28 family peptidase n=1 Tax=Amycolatopsis benzoatilytica TaxID=346045 RepID=UPI0009FD38C3|nr:M28 family peptidase [Amycolatopsis benzoatilytica]